MLVVVVLVVVVLVVVVLVVVVLGVVVLVVVNNQSYFVKKVTGVGGSCWRWRVHTYVYNEGGSTTRSTNKNSHYELRVLLLYSDIWNCYLSELRELYLYIRTVFCYLLYSYVKMSVRICVTSYKCFRMFVSAMLYSMD